MSAIPGYLARFELIQSFVIRLINCTLQHNEWLNNMEQFGKKIPIYIIFYEVWSLHSFSGKRKEHSSLSLCLYLLTFRNVFKGLGVVIFRTRDLIIILCVFCQVIIVVSQQLSFAQLMRLMWFISTYESWWRGRFYEQHCK